MYNDAMLLAQRRLSPVMSMIQEEFPGYHPLLAIARIAHKEGVDVELAFNCHKVIAKYVEPELKSMEIKTDPDNRRRVTVSLFQEEPEVIESQSGGLVLEHDNRV